MNSVELVGRLTKKPETRYGGQDNAVAVTRFTLAVNDGKETDFISCKALGKWGEWADKWLDKGSKVELKGKIKTGSYEKNDAKVYYTEVLANFLEFGESKAEADARRVQAPQAPAESEDFITVPDGCDEELPFN